MAIVVDADDLGVWAAVECDKRGCQRHVSARPAAPDWSAYELVCTVFDWAAEEGWRLDGQAWCPDHRLEPRGDRQLRDRFDWLRVRKGARPGRYGPS